MKTYTQSSGFTLVAVLVLISMATVVVLSSMNDSIIQERLSGNFQKKMSARLSAEKGTYEMLAQLNNALANDSDLGIADAVEANSHLSSDIDDSSSYTTQITNDGNTVVISSTGTKYEGQGNVTAVFEYVPGSSSSASGGNFSSGVTGCSVVTVTAGGNIDSYDSTLGAYEDQPPSAEAFVHTLSESGTILLNGGTEIAGDLISANSLQLSGGASVTGNIHSNGSISLTGNNTIGGNATSYTTYQQVNGSVLGSIRANLNLSTNQTPVGGSVSSQGDVNITGQNIGGSVYSGNNTALLQNARVAGNIQVINNYSQTGGTVTGNVDVKGDVHLTQWGSKINGDLRYTGTGTFQGDTDEYYYAPYKVSTVNIDTSDSNALAIPVTKINLGDEEHRGISECDPLDIINQIEMADSVETVLPDLVISNYGSGDSLELSTNIANYIVNNSSTPIGPINTANGDFLDTETQFYYFNDVKILGHVSVKSGEKAVLYVRGDFAMEGASSLTIPDNSSLTIIIQETMTIASGSQVYTPDNGITDDGRPVFSIYSSYAGSSVGLTFAGGTEQIYAAIYAPFSTVDVTSGVAFKGSILADTVNVDGSGGIHVDVALSGSSFSGSSGTTSSGYMKFVGLVYDKEVDSTHAASEGSEEVSDEI